MIAKLEQFVNLLVKDETFRRDAVRDPEGVAARFGLTGPERQGALALCAQVAGPAEIMWPAGFWI